MADTLAEIHSSTLQESDFNSSGEATLVTTDSSTKHVIKDVHIEEGDTNFKVEPYLNIGGFNTVQLTANASGSEIVGPSSTVKLKTSTFPLVYQDYNFIAQSSNSQYAAVVTPRVNNKEGFASSSATQNNAIGHSNFTTTATNRALYLDLGPNNYTMLLYSDMNSSTGLQLKQSDGTQVVNYTNSYMPWWFDDTQYVYRYNGSTSYIERLDSYTGTLTNQWKPFNIGQQNSTYSRMFGVNNPDGTTAYLFFWAAQQGLAAYYDFANDETKFYTSSAVSSTYHNMNNFYYAVMKSDGSIVHLSGQNNSIVYEYTWEPNTVYTTSKYNAYSNVQLSSGQQLFVTLNAFKQVIGSKLYYYADGGSPYSSSTVAFIDFDKSADGRFGTTGFTLNNVTSYGYGLNLAKTTPDSSTIAGRTYNLNPSFKVRMTGITST